MYKFIILGLFMTSILSGCSTSSRADEFLKNNEKEKLRLNVVDKTIAEDSSSQIFDQITNIQSTNSANVSKTNSYQNYSPIALNNAQIAGKTIVLISFDEDCSSCKALERSINQSLSRIPDNTVFFKIDHDKDGDLIMKYNITEANTIIVLNSDGSEKKRSSGGIYKIEKLLYYL